jgi:hypothetical protein
MWRTLGVGDRDVDQQGKRASANLMRGKNPIKGQGNTMTYDASLIGGVVDEIPGHDHDSRIDIGMNE